MFTKELLLNNSYMAKMLARQKRFVKCVLTTAEMNESLKNGGRFEAIMNDKVFWFTDDYCMGGNGMLPPEFVPSSAVCPYQIAPRESLPTGIVRTAEDFINGIAQDRRQITSIEELVEYLNLFHRNPAIIGPTFETRRYHILADALSAYKPLDAIAQFEYKGYLISMSTAGLSQGACHTEVAIFSGRTFEDQLEERFSTVEEAIDHINALVK